MKKIDELSSEIATKMEKAHKQLDDKNQGVTITSTAPLKDMTTPKLILDKKELRNISGRKIIRKSFMNSLVKDLSKKNLEVSIKDEKIEIKTIKKEANVYTSLDGLVF